MSEVRRRIQRIGPLGFETSPADPKCSSANPQLRRFGYLSADRIGALGRIQSGWPEMEAPWRMLQHLGIHLADHSFPEFERLIETPLESGDEIFAFHDAERATNERIDRRHQ